MTTCNANDLIIGFLNDHLEQKLSGLTMRDFKTERAGGEGKARRCYRGTGKPHRSLNCAPFSRRIQYHSH